MPIAEQFLTTDNKAYHISVILDERVKDFLEINSLLVKKNEKNLKEILSLCSKINDIFHGFDNPPREILKDVSEEALLALKEYYQVIKNDLLKKSNLKIIFGYEVIRLAFNFWSEVPKYLFRIEEMQSSQSSLADIEMLYMNLQEEKKRHKYTLLTSKNTTPIERMYLYNYFSDEVDNIVIHRLVQIYSNKLNNKILKEVTEFCIDNSIPLKTSDLSKKILISDILYKKFEEAKLNIENKFEDYKVIGLEIVNNELARLENSYLTTALPIDQLDPIIILINELLDKIKAEKNKTKIKEYTDVAQNKYDGVLKSEVIEWIRMLNKDILSSGYTEKIENIYRLRIENAN
jgi:hypothetical protein